MQHHKRMLIAEDSMADVMLVRLAIEETGLPIEIVHMVDGEAAIKYIQSHDHPEVTFMLLDLNIPKANGIDILKQKSRSEAWRHIPAILYSSSSRQEDVRMAFASGASAYITKPVDFEQFNRKIKHLAVFWGEMNVSPQG